MTIDYPRRIVTTWYSRGKNAESTFDCFICLWIALNAALSVRFGRLGDRAKVMRFAEELASGWAGWLEADDALRAAASELERLSPIFDDPPWPDGHRDEASVSATDAVSVMLGVYAVRNNLFHGAKQFDVMRDHVLVRTSGQLLERVFVDSGILAMAEQPFGDLTSPLRRADGERAAI